MNKPDSRLNRTIFHADLDAFFVTVEQVLNPELWGKPVIVGGRPDSRGVVSSASYEARKFGVHAAMPLSQARRLCPQAIFLTGNYRRYGEFSGKFMAILADYSPSLEPGGLDEAYLDVSGCENFGSWRNLALKIKQRIRHETGLIASIGVAPCKVVAKIASDLSKPDGLIEVAQGEEKALLAPLPVQKLPGVGEKTGKVLGAMGIKTIGDLAGMPLSLYKSRFGEGMLWLHRHANGIDDSPVQPWGEAKSASRETTFDTDTLDDDLLRATLRYFSEKLGAELREMGKKARTIGLKLRYSDFETVNRSHTLKTATNLDDEIYGNGVKLLETTLARNRRPVRLIGLEVANFSSGATQLGLFEAEYKKMEQLDHAVDRIREKYGFDAIRTGTTMDFRRKHKP
jgi:DNA polymerase-4